MGADQFLIYMLMTLNMGFWIGMVVGRIVLEHRYEFIERKPKAPVIIKPFNPDDEIPF